MTKAEAQVAKWVAKYGKSEAERRAYVSGGSNEYRQALIVAASKAEG